MLLKRVLTILLMGLMLLADSGQTIYANTCLKSKQTRLSISQPKHCCSMPAKVAGCNIKKPSCCEVSAKLLKANLVSSSQSVNYVAIPQLLAVANMFNLLPIPGGSLTITPTNQLIPLPPATAAFTHTFRI